METKADTCYAVFSRILLFEIETPTQLQMPFSLIRLLNSPAWSPPSKDSVGLVVASSTHNAQH